MKLELNLMELNSLYVAVSNQLKEAKLDASLYPSEFFQNQLIIAEELVEKVQEALWDECKAADEAIEKFRMDTGITEIDKIESLELDIELWEGERNYYASIGEWERCNQINSMIESWQEEVDALKDEITK
jgi:hypothetical protein